MGLTPIIQDEILTYLQGNSLAQIVVGSSEWYTWLQTASTFTFRSGEAHFTARKERAGNRRGEPYWRAYQKRGGKLHRVYLGKSGELSLERLRTTAALLTGQDAGDGSLHRQEQTAGTSLSPPPSSHKAHRPHPQTPVENSRKARPFFPNLPVPLTPLIGREQEQAAVCRLLRRSEVRLVTLTGTGGVGKTRLGLQVATDLLDEFADGIPFISLAPISDPDLVLPVIAGTLAIKETGAQPLLDLLKASLQHKHLLLVLDNFEQLLPAAPQLTDLLASCPQLKLLVTSRSTLHVQGEHEFAVPPLAVPDLMQLPTLAELAQVETMSLFVARAQAIKADFALTEVNARAIAEICVHLDGLPLAIELAAARSKLLPPQALLRRLSHRFEVLTGGAQDLPKRQQTLRNTIQWSYDLLTEQEQRLFRTLSIFVSGCELAAAETVCGTIGEGRFSVLDGVASLLDKGLLLPTGQQTHEPRLFMLETVREYGLECLHRNAEEEITRGAHAAYYLWLAEEAEPHLFSAGQVHWLERLEREHDNIRAALHWLIEQEEREMALRLGEALLRFWRVRGSVSEGRNFLERALIGSNRVKASVRARALNAAGDLALSQYDTDRAEGLSRESLAISQELGDKRAIASSLMVLGQVAQRRDNFEAARTILEEGLMLFKELDDKEGIAEALSPLALVAFFQSDYARAYALAEESLALLRELGDKWKIADVLLQVVTIASFQGEYARTHILAGESLVLQRELAAQGGIALALNVMGDDMLNQGDYARARELLEEGLIIYRELGIKEGIARSLYSLGRVTFGQGDYATAQTLHEESLTLYRELGNTFLLALSLEELGAVVAAQERPVWTARLLGVASTLREALGSPPLPFERTNYNRMVAYARTQLGEEVFAKALAEGRTMTPEQALAAREPATMPQQVCTESPLTSLAKASTNLWGLTAREMEVLRLLARGLSNAQIAEALVVSLLTVKAHLRSIYSKLGVTSRSAATRYALEHHLS